jgi:hypothetical protein
MKLFIDTGVLLATYRSSGADLEQYRELVRLVEGGEIDLLLSQRVVSGFWREREAVVADALSQLRECGTRGDVPDICRSYAVEAADLGSAVACVNTALAALESRMAQDASAGALEADRIVEQLFAATAPEPVENFLPAARSRADMGDPPGSLSDAVDWEWLLGRGISLDTTEIVLLSTNPVYESRVVRGQLAEFLHREWTSRYPYCALRLEPSLARLLRDFADLSPVDEQD